MGHFEIVAEVQGVGAGNVTVCLKEAHGQGISFNERATNKLCQNIQRHLDTRHGIDDTGRDHKDEAENDTIENNTGASVGWPVGDTSAAESNRNDKHDHVPPLRHLTVRLHQTVVNIKDLVLLNLSLLGRAKAVDEVLESHHNLQTVVKETIGQSASIDTEEEHVDGNVTSGEEGRRIRLILGVVKDATIVQD